MNLIRMLPFLETEELDDLVDAIINQEIADNKYSAVMTLPFLNDKQIDKLFQAALDGKIDSKPVHFLPFVSETTLDVLIEKASNKELDALSIDELMPFLSREQIRRLFKAHLESIKQK